MDIFNGYGVEIELGEQEDFLKVRETLERIGVASQRTKTLYQSCHILHKQGRYAILHFKELFALDGRPTDFTDEDEARRNTIVSLLQQWGLCNVITNKDVSKSAPVGSVKIIPYRERQDWSLVPKYNIGKKK